MSLFGKQHEPTHQPHSKAHEKKSLKEDEASEFAEQPILSGEITEAVMVAKAAEEPDTPPEKKHERGR